MPISWPGLILSCSASPRAPLHRGQLSGLEAAVRAGTGLAGWHGGIADSYRGSSDYLHLIGGQFACHPGKHPENGSRAPRPTPTCRTASTCSPQASGASDHGRYRRLRPGHRAVLGPLGRLQRRPGDNHAEGPRLGPVAPRSDFASHLDPAVGPGQNLRCHSRAQPGHPEHPSVRTIIERGLLWASR